MSDRLLEEKSVTIASSQSDISEGQVGLFPKGRHEGLASLHTAQSTARDLAELGQVLGTEVGELMLFAGPPHILYGVELRRIGWQSREPDRALAGLDVLLDQSAPVHALSPSQMMSSLRRSCPRR